MKKINLIIITLLLLPIITYAKHPRPVSFEVNSRGEFFGLLEDGTEFSQINLVADFKIQKFNWEKGFWYVSDKGIINAENDLQAISIYMAK